MIEIVNLGPCPEEGPEGWHYYEVRINGAFICEFNHVRRDGLVECLCRAATAVRSANQKEGKMPDSTCEQCAQLQAEHDRLTSALQAFDRQIGREHELMRQAMTCLYENPTSDSTAIEVARHIRTALEGSDGQ